MDLILPALVMLLPLLITPGLLFHYDSVPKIVLLALAMAIVIANPRVLRARAAELWRTDLGKWLCILAIAQIASTAIATIFSARVEFSLFGSGWRRFGLITISALAVLIVFAAASLLNAPERIRSVLRATAIAAIGVSAYTILQYFNIDPLQNGAGYHAQDGDFTIVRPPGTLGHADYLGWWLAIALFCSWGLYRAEQGYRRSLAIAATVIAPIAIVLSGTRSAIGAAALGLLFLVVTGRVQWNRKLLLSAGVVAVLAVAFYLSPAGKMLQARVKWSGDEAPGGARPLLWRDSLKMAAARPLTGFGPETFAAEFPLYQSEELSRLVPDFYHESPHNVLLDAITSEGLPGFVIHLGWMLVALIAILRSKKSDPIDAGLAAALVASFGMALFNSMTIGPAVATAVTMSALVTRVASSRETNEARTIRIPALMPRLISIVFAGALAGFAVLLTWSDYKLEQFSQISQRRMPMPAVAAYQGIRAAVLKGAGDDLFCSRRLAASCGAGTNAIERLQCTQSATQAAQRATVTADNPPNAWYNLAMFAAAYSDSRGAEQALRGAIDAAPNWYRPHWALANYLKLTGRVEEARVQMERAAYLSAGKVSQVGESLRTIAQAR